MLENIDYVPVLANDGTKLMPTSPYRARKLLEKKKAKVYKCKPFSIMLTHDSAKNTQPIELCQDTGSNYIGMSVKSEKREFIHAQFDNLTNEKERHDNCCKYRRDRRNHKRYRKPRFNNRKRDDGWIAPSLENKLNNHLNIIHRICEVFPITTICVEVGSFDTQKLEAIEKGLALPESTDYQNGPKKNFETLRQAVFFRDNYTCQVCGKGITDKAIFNVHHIGFWQNDHSDRLDNLMTVCTKCHTAKNHKPGGKLYGLEPKLKPFKGAAFMNTVRWMLYNSLKGNYPEINIKTQYGSDTRISRTELGLDKTHANDAYSMGEFYPKLMSEELHYQKRRRNNRVLQKFYDAKYLDKRDGSTKKGSEIGCNRTNRREPRNSDKNERIYRGHKISKGKVTIRQQRYFYQPGDIVLFNGQKLSVIGAHCNGTRVLVKLNDKQKSLSINKIKLYRKAGDWCLIPA